MKQPRLFDPDKSPTVTDGRVAVSAPVMGAPGGLPAEALGGPPSRYALPPSPLRGFGGQVGGQPSRASESEGWAHFEFTRINIEPIILRKKFEDVREAGASKANRQ